MTVVRAWATAAHSTSYLDPTPGSWTQRTKPLVTGPEAAAELIARRGRGGSTWAQIVEHKCVMTLHDLTAQMAPDVPSGPRTRLVLVSGIQALTCGDRTTQLFPITAQVTARRVADRWLVAQVTH